MAVHSDKNPTEKPGDAKMREMEQAAAAVVSMVLAKRSAIFAKQASVNSPGTAQVSAWVIGARIEAVNRWFI